MIHPIIDQYYNYDPYYSRSSKFAVEKGLVASTTSTTPGTVTPLPPNPLEDLPKRPRIPESIFRTRSSEAQSQSGPHLIRVMTSDSSSSGRSHSENNTPIDIWRVKPLPGPPRQQEQTNTKKKRRSLPQELLPESESDQGTEAVTPEERPSYGDPAKIAQFFPELNLPRRTGSGF
jgi:glutamine amidotransferase